MQALDQSPKSLLAGAKRFLGELAVRHVACHGEYALLPSNIDAGRRDFADADFARPGAVTEFFILSVAGLADLVYELRVLPAVDKDVEVFDRLAEDLFAAIARELDKTFVNVDVAAVRKCSKRYGIRAGF